MCCSRLARDRYGRLVAIVTVADEATCVGQAFLCLGDTVEAGGLTIGWMGSSSGRTSTAKERWDAGAHERARATQARRARRARTPQERREVPDGLLADEEAIEQARLEQEREPADLIGRVPSTLADTTSTPERLGPARDGTLATMRLDEARSL